MTSYTRAKMSELIFSFDINMNPEPTMMLVPLRRIKPVYEPCPTFKSAPAAGFPIRDLWSSHNAT